MAGDDADHQDQLARLPDDVIAEILRRVTSRWLATVRCVRKAWRDAVDSRRLLRADLLPLYLAGIFIHYEKHKFPEYLARPFTAGSRAVTTDLSFLPSETPILQCEYWQIGYASNYNIQDHCKGLLLLSSNCVVNPATGRWYSLLTCPSQDVLGGVSVFQNPRLVYDPIISPYYKVFSILTLDKTDLSMDESVEWPPSVCKMYVFSSKSDGWEEKDFVRDGDAVGTVGEMQKGYSECRAVYFRGVLYVHCETDYLMRVSLSSNTYTIVKPPPMDLKVEGYMHTSIARSEKGVYFWALHQYWLRVWILTESSGQMEWMLKHDKELKPVQARRRSVHSPWILEDINYKLFRSSHSPQHKDKPPTGEIFEWNSDDDDGVENKDTVEHCNLEGNTPLYLGDIEILGFHPYKEVVFLSSSTLTGLAYHLNGSKIEVLGDIHPKEYYFFPQLINEGKAFRSFPYTPCGIEEF